MGSRPNIITLKYNRRLLFPPEAVTFASQRAWFFYMLMKCLGLVSFKRKKKKANVIFPHKVYYLHYQRGAAGYLLLKVAVWLA